jgi:hypothetical protein
VTSGDDEGGNAKGESNNESVVEVPVPLQRDSDDDDEKSGLFDARESRQSRG